MKASKHRLQIKPGEAANTGYSESQVKQQTQVTGKARQSSKHRLQVKPGEASKCRLQ